MLLISTIARAYTRIGDIYFLARNFVYLLCWRVLFETSFGQPRSYLAKND